MAKSIVENTKRSQEMTRGAATASLEEAIGHIKIAMVAREKNIQNSPDIRAAKIKTPAITPDTFRRLDAELFYNNLNWNLVRRQPDNPRTPVGKMLSLMRAVKNLKKQCMALLDQQKSFNASVTQSINILRDFAVYHDDEISRLRSKISSIEASLPQGFGRERPDGPEVHTIPDGPEVHAIYEQELGGSREEGKEKQRAHITFFKDKSAVLEAGCGRGEFFELLLEYGIDAIGVDTDDEAVSFCRDRGLPALKSDLPGYLASLEDASLVGIFAARAVGQLPPSSLMDFIRLSFSKLGPSGILVLEAADLRCSRAVSDCVERLGPSVNGPRYYAIIGMK